MRGRSRDPDSIRRTSQPPRWKPAVMPSLPLARRLEAMRRVLANPDARIRRFAMNWRALPRCFRLRKWSKNPCRFINGRRMIIQPMPIVHPLACDLVDERNEAAEPG